MQNKKVGVLMINLGTPDSFEKKDVRKYLRQFLSDKRVIDIPCLFRMLLLYFIILPFRTKKSAHAYRSIWFKEGSPLLVHSQHLVHKVQFILGQTYAVELAMRYQNPSISYSIKNLIRQNVSKIVVFPLFPQYASAATGSALENVYTELANDWNVVPISVIPAFYEHPLFIDCFVNRIQGVLSKFKADYILFSYHGLPERHILKSECGQKNVCLKGNNCCAEINEANYYCYRAQCFSTTRSVIHQLNQRGLQISGDAIEKRSSNAFQSRLGRTKWIEPYTDVVLPELVQKGFKNLVVVCPAFVADCLETLEEISIRAQEQWKSLGGEELVLVPSLNSEDDWAEACSQIIATATL